MIGRSFSISYTKKEAKRLFNINSPLIFWHNTTSRQGRQEDE